MNSASPVPEGSLPGREGIASRSLRDRFAIGHVVELLHLIDRSQQPPDRLVTHFFKDRRYLGSRDRRFVSSAAFGIIRHRRLAEALLEQYLNEHPEHAELDALPARYVAVYTAFALAQRREPSIAEQGETLPLPPNEFWKASFPTIEMQPVIDWMDRHVGMDFLGADATVRLGVRYSFQDWMIDRWLTEVGDETESLLRALNTSAPVTLRVNLLKTTRDECRERLAREGIETDPTRWSPVGLTTRKRFSVQSSAAFRDGWFEVQDEGSQLVAFAAGPEPGSTVIDACAGAGGKTLHLAQLMQNRGEIVAIDTEGRRLAELESRAKRAGVQIVRTHKREGVDPESLRERADLVLVDAPCSGVGTIRRNPGLKWSVSESAVGQHADRQKEILDFSANFVKPGGRLLYVTCSLFREENEAVMDWFLGSHTSFTSQRIDLASYTDFRTESGRVTLFPHRTGTDGFFLAIASRIANP